MGGDRPPFSDMEPIPSLMGFGDIWNPSLLSWMLVTWLFSHKVIWNPSLLNSTPIHISGTGLNFDVQYGPFFSYKKSFKSALLWFPRHSLRNARKSHLNFGAFFQATILVSCFKPLHCTAAILDGELGEADISLPWNLINSGKTAYCNEEVTGLSVAGDRLLSSN